MRFIRALAPYPTWSSLVARQPTLTEWPKTYVTGFVELALDSLWTHENRELGRLISDIVWRSVDQSIMPVLLFGLEAAETGILEFSDDDLGLFKEKSLGAAHALLSSGASVIDRRDALYVGHVMSLEQTVDASTLEAAADLGQPYAMYDLAEIAVGKKDAQSLELWAVRAVARGHIRAALLLVEWFAGTTDSPMPDWVLDAVVALCGRGQPTAMLDAALLSPRFRHAIYLAAAEDNAQALHILGNGADMRFEVADPVLRAARALDTEADVRSNARAILRQEFALCIAKELLS